MKLIFVLLFFILEAQCEPPFIKRIMGYPNSNSISKQKHPFRGIMLQIRSGGRPMMHLKSPMLMSRIRPYSILPQSLINHHNFQMMKRPNSLSNFIAKKPFFSSQPGPHTGEYVFENPFGNVKQNQQLKPSQPIENTIRLTIDNGGGPIHTIPAPNLSSINSGTYTDFTYPHDNHISLTDSNAHAFHGYTTVGPMYSTVGPSYSTVGPTFSTRGSSFSTMNPVRIHQYQVTEEPTNDLILQDPYSGYHKYFAPDPDPSLPARGISPSSDPYSKPSNRNPQPFDVASAASFNQNLYQFVDPIPQQQLSDTYGLPINTQPQLQQHLLQQASLVPSMPVSVYNPTYLVTQSNSLYNQHQQQLQQQLFKPEVNYLAAYNNPSTNSPQFQPSYNYPQGDSDPTYSVASAGQLYASSQDENNLQDQFLAAASQNSPAIMQYIDSSSQRPTSPSLTNEEYSNLINFEKYSKSPFTSTPIPYEYTSRQEENEKIIDQANREMYESQFLQRNVPSTPSTSTTASDIHNQHNQLLSQQFSQSLQPMRIFVPDDDEYQEQNNNRNSYQDIITERSDDGLFDNVDTEPIVNSSKSKSKNQTESKEIYETELSNEVKNS